MLKDSNWSSFLHKGKRTTCFDFHAVSLYSYFPVILKWIYLRLSIQPKNFARNFFNGFCIDVFFYKLLNLHFFNSSQAEWFSNLGLLNSKIFPEVLLYIGSLWLDNEARYRFTSYCFESPTQWHLKNKDFSSYNRGLHTHTYARTHVSSIIT